MAADIVILDIREQAGGLATIRFALWFDIANPYPAPGTLSAYPDIASDPVAGPNGQNIPNKLMTGTTAEEVYTVLLPVGFLGANWSTVVEPYILAILNARKAYKNGTAPASPAPGLKYKTLHDSSTGWTA